MNTLENVAAEMAAILAALIEGDGVADERIAAAYQAYGEYQASAPLMICVDTNKVSREQVEELRRAFNRALETPHPDAGPFLIAEPSFPLTGLMRQFPLGARMEKVSGPEWDSKVVGYYSSSFTPEGLVLESMAPGSKGQVHVEPAKRVQLRLSAQDEVMRP